MNEAQAMESEYLVRPSDGTYCQAIIGLDPAGKRLLCPCKSTLHLNGKMHCDKHAELIMMEACGRPVTIERRQ